MAGGLLDQRADTFAIGVTLYEMLHQELPFSSVERMASPTPLSDLIPEVPDLVAKAVMRAIRIKPANHWQSAATIAAHLAQIIQAVAAGKTAV